MYNENDNPYNNFLGIMREQGEINNPVPFFDWRSQNGKSFDSSHRGFRAGEKRFENQQLFAEKLSAQIKFGNHWSNRCDKYKKWGRR